MTSPRGPELDAELRDEPSSGEVLRVVDPVRVAAECLLAAWDADGAGHAMRCSPAMVGAVVELKRAMREVE